MAVIDEKPPSLPPVAEGLPGSYDRDPYVGHTFGGRYEILSKIGEGSQARVYVARHVLIDRHVAVKFLFPVLASDTSLVARFLNEGRAAGTLGHPNIVESIDMGFAPDGAPYLVLELLKGRTLAEEIQVAGALSPGRAAYIASQAASALSAAHARGIVHRDLKPANMLLVDRGGRPDHVKVVDFGISKFTAAGSRVTTIKGEPLGTPGFMAPEQIEDPLGIDSRADVYGLGATLYDMLAGGPPFAEVGFPKVLRLIVEEEPRRLAEMKPHLPAGLVAIVERAMSKSPEDRFQTMDDFEDALSGFAEAPSRVRSPESRPAAAPIATPAPAPVVLRTSSETPSPPVEEPPFAPKSPRKRRVAGLAMLLLGALALLVALRAATSAESRPRTIERAPAPGLQAALTPDVPSPTRTTALTAPMAEASIAVVPAAPSASAQVARTQRPAIHPSPAPQVRSNTPPAPHPSANSSLETINCSPPFYYEGKKKIFKAGCI